MSNDKCLIEDYLEQSGKTETYQLPKTLDLIGWGTRIRT